MSKNIQNDVYIEASSADMYTDPGGWCTVYKKTWRRVFVCRILDSVVGQMTARKVSSIYIYRGAQTYTLYTVPATTCHHCHYVPQLYSNIFLYKTLIDNLICFSSKNTYMYI